MRNVTMYTNYKYNTVHIEYCWFLTNLPMFDGHFVSFFRHIDSSILCMPRSGLGESRIPKMKPMMWQIFSMFALRYGKLT